MFNNERNGYNKKEVDAFVAKQKADLTAVNSDLKAQNVELKAEIEEIKAELRKRKQNEEQIKDAMLLAAEKTKEVDARLAEAEEAAREYKLQCERVKKLYYKWASTIDAVHKKYGLINVEELNTRKFYLDIETLFDNNLNKTPKANIIARPESQIVVDNSDDALEEQKIHHKELLSRMSGLLQSVSASVRDASRHKLTANKPSTIETKTANKPVQEAEFEKETKRVKAAMQEQPQTAPTADVKPAEVEESGKDMIKPIGNMDGDYKGYSSLLDKYLSIGDDDMGAYGKVITNSQEKQKVEAAPAREQLADKKQADALSKELNLPKIEMGVGTNGFDLKEAVTPKESLEDIMKIFDI